MNQSTYGFSMMGLVILTLVLRLMNKGDVSSWAIRIGALLVMLMLVIISVIVYNANKRRGTNETLTWLIFIVASVLNLIGGVFEVLPSIYLSMSNPELMTLMSSALFLLTYIAFIIGLAVANYRFREFKKVNVWIPSIVVSILLAIGLYFLISYMAKTGNADMITRIAFIIFIIMDAVLALLAWLLATRTWGGSLSSSYVTIAIGCIALVIFHIIATTFMITNIGFNVDSLIRLLYVVAIGLIGIGGDIRLSIEEKLAI